MATYAFKAVDMAGAATRGEVDADDKQTVASQLRSRGLIVVDVEEQKPTDVGDIFARFRRVKAEDLTIASRQLSTMISSGMSMLRALYVARGAGREPEASRRLHRRPQGHRGRPVRSRARWRRHPADLQRALRGDGGRRRDRRQARGDPRARGRPAREGRRPEAPGEVGDDVPGADHQLLDHRRASRSWRS